MQKILITILRFFAKRILSKYKPEIIAITGSVGKTSAKEAIATVLSFKFSVRKTLKNYNNEIGLPLTVIGVESGKSSVIGWSKVFYHAIKLLMIKDLKYPQILILEMGADKPGDIEYLMEIAQPSIGVLTAVAEAHLELFKSLENVLKEKEKVVLKLPVDGRALVNFDDPLAKTVLEKVKGNYYSFGFEQGADIRALEMFFAGLDDEACSTQNDWDCHVWGTGFKVAANGSTVPLFLPHVLGKQNVYAALAAIGVGLHYKMNLIDITESLRMFRGVPGRMSLLAGIKGSMIIDDTYNSSPVAVKAALATIASIGVREGAKRIAVLGDMLELGDDSSELHAEMGKVAAKSNLDLLICVGPQSKYTSESAKKAGMNVNNIYYFENRDQAGLALQELISPNDIVLIKGSQGMRMEFIVKEVMADPLRANELLVRQGWEWEI
jgi:UDP-N-acetylmuramoyl-tripeptide--D-alanyl-D-alanine ligase